MSYTITLRIYQTNTNAFFRVVEAAVWTAAGGGTWDAVRGEHVLTVNSGSAGVLRLVSDTGEVSTVALGVHEDKRWCDIVTGLQPGQTAASVLGEYYVAGGTVDRSYMRKKQAESYAVTSLGPQARKYTVAYSVATGANLKANLTIG
ncbi:fungal fruit body lectin [Phanerochaete sordida]|uniref:Fungal fruit body lectin n=1 Tax=Phanerochaete sordida TaxID=48140 RepID=A0A9P3LMA5_9APHY|nr:fungal fruit body lectin [Phanerochaete sordida]